jgi:hypothetical protein
VYLKGRALPHFYSVHLGPRVRFVLGLSGWTANRWTGTAGMDLLLEPERDEALAARVLGLLRERFHASTEEVVQALGADKARVATALAAQCAAGRVMFDVEARRWRHRELFATPVDLGRMYPPDPRREEAERLTAVGQVVVTSEDVRETRKVRKLPTPEGHVLREVVHRDWVVHGSVGPQTAVELVLNDEDRLLFGTCKCEFFRENLMNHGPCAHLLALLRVAKARRKERASSAAPSEAALEALRQAERPEARSDQDGEGETLDEDGGDDDNR